METHPPRLAEVHVVSDIHMGGERDGDRNFQVFCRGQRLAALLRDVAARRPDEEVAFVLNGDIVDSLSEDVVPGYVALDAGIALRMMERIYADPEFAPVWSALSDFVRRPRRHLVFVVGNHDIELSLPVVESSIRGRLAGGTAEAQARIHFATHGGGFACSVGATRVFCTHGNERDVANWVDYNLLGQLANAMNAGRSIPSSKWKPNAGTRLVVDVMNDVKRQYPFVDLLKPESAAVACVLLALDRDALKHIDLFEDLPIVGEAVRGALVTRRILGAEATALSGAPSEAVANEMVARLLGPQLAREVAGARRGTRGEDELLLEAERAVAEGQLGTSDLNLGAERLQGTLGGWDLFRGWLGLIPKLEGLRLALADWIGKSTDYHVGAEDWLSKAMVDHVGDGVGFVVTGHSHLARALRRGQTSFYYNCGTWIRLLRLTDEALAKEAFEKELWPALTNGKMSALDEALIPGPGGEKVPLLFDRTNVVRIGVVGGQVTGELLRVGDGPNGAAAVAPEPNTTPFTIG